MHSAKSFYFNQTVRFVILFSVIGFVLNLFWEYFQCSPFFRHINVNPTIGAMTAVTLGDVAIMWLIYIFSAVLNQTTAWYKMNLNIEVAAKFFAASVCVSIAFELWALKENRWSYTENNPILPLIGVSILPVLQMVLINPVTMILTKKILNSLAQAKQNQRESL